MAGEQVFIGLATSGLCAAGLVREQWFLTETPKGRWLVNSFGTRKAIWVLRGLFALGVLFGLALASGFVNPIRWTATAKEARSLAASDCQTLAGEPPVAMAFSVPWQSRRWLPTASAA